MMATEVLHIERLVDGAINANANVLFDSTIIASSNISYDSGTGAITLLEPGIYEFNWWVATQTSVSTSGMGFVLESTQGDILIGNSPIKTGEVVGFGIIEVEIAPVTVELKNNSTATILYAPTVPVKSVLTVFGGESIGATGPTGPQGEIGPTGPEGPTGPGITVFGYVFTPFEENSETAVTLPGNILFSDNGLLEGITHAAGTAEIIVPTDGPYMISFSLTLGNAVDLTVSIAINGVVVDSSSVPSQAMAGTLSSSMILSLLADDIVTLMVE